jgi:branched-chain amino acid transport system permease protein
MMRPCSTGDTGKIPRGEHHMAAITERLTPKSAESRRTLIAGLFVAAFVAVVIWQSWAGNPITFDSILFWIIAGVTFGSVYAVAATGLVVTYTTSGIFNFAQGAIGMFMAYVFWGLHTAWGIQTFVALLLTVFVAAPLMGAIIERVLMRRMADAPLVAQIVTTVGLMLMLMGLAAKIWDPQVSRRIDRFFGTSGFHIGETLMPWSRFITIVVGLGLAIGLKFLLSKTRLGVAMRAVVDNRELASLNGIRPGRVSMFSWALGSSMAAIAGIFLAEELATLDVQTLTLLIIAAFAAAIIGRLKSLPLTFAGGLLIGLVFEFQQNFLNWGGRWVTAPAAIPQIMLFLALLFLPQAALHGKKAIRSVVPRIPSLKKASLGMAILFAAVFVLGAMQIDRTDVRTLTLALVTSLAMLSMVPLTGWSKQISLAQITFAGCGAFAYLEWAHTWGSVGGLFIAALFAVPFGIAMALPALRLQGLYLALASMAFAQMASFLFFPQPEILGFDGRPIEGITILGWHTQDPFTFLGINFGQDVGQMFVFTFLLGVMGVLIVALHRSRFGRRLTALGDSPAACATLGVNQIATKLAVFILSAAVAGFAGALLGILQGTATVQDFDMLQGLGWLLLLVVGGVSVVSGAVLGGLFLTSFSWIAAQFPGNTYLDWWQRLGPGLAGIGIGRQPSGIIPTVGQEQRDKKARKRAGQEPSELPPPPLAGDAAATAGAAASVPAPGA